MQRKLCTKLLLFFPIILLIGCASEPRHDFECMPVEQVFSYPVDQWTPSKPSPTYASPQKYSWDLQFDEQKIGTPSQLISRGKEQLWMLNSGIFMYNKITKQVKQYPIGWNVAENIPGQLLLAKDGTLWALNWRTKERIPILSRFDDQEDRFISIPDSKNILVTDGALGNMAEDSRGRLWLSLTDDGLEGLYVFDPSNLSVEKIESDVIDANTLNGNIVIDKDDGVWLGTYSESSFNSVYLFDPKTLETLILPIGQSISGIGGGLLIDSKDRLWIGDFAYWDIGDPFPGEGSNGVQLIIRSPLFISQRMPFKDYYWLRPEVLFEDSDGNIWYSADISVMLNTETNTWCKVFDDSSIATEDHEGNFWLISSGKIYKHK